MTLKDVLNDADGRKVVEAIEDTLSSLRSQPGNPDLTGVLHRQIEELEQKTGYRYRTD